MGVEPVEHLLGLLAAGPRCVTQDEQSPPLPRELEPGRRHGGPQPVQCRYRVVVQHGSKRPVHFIIRVHIDYPPQPSMQRGVSPERRIHREVTRLGVFVHPGSQAGAQQRGQTTIHLLLGEGVGDVRFPNQLAEPPVEIGVGPRSRWRSAQTPRALVRQLLQLGDATVLPTAYTMVLNDIDQASR